MFGNECSLAQALDGSSKVSSKLTNGRQVEVAFALGSTEGGVNGEADTCKGWTGKEWRHCHVAAAGRVGQGGAACVGGCTRSSNDAGLPSCQAEAVLGGLSHHGFKHP